MTTYTQTPVEVPVGLDEAGLRLSLSRLPEESLVNYRRRLILEARDPAEPTEASLIRGIGRKVGVFDAPVLEIDLILDSNDVPLAADPHVAITSTFFRAYNDLGNDELDIEINMTSTRWLKDIYDALVASTYFSTTKLDEYADYLKGVGLRYDTTERFRARHTLFQSYENALPDGHINEIWFSDTPPFRNEVSLLASVVDEGDYYVDYVNGVLFTGLVMAGSASYKYQQFPYKVFHQPVRTVPYADDDLQYDHFTFLVDDDTGTELPGRLNSEGAGIANRVLNTHSLGWGE